MEHSANNGGADASPLPFPTGAACIVRGATRLLVGLGYRTLPEVPLANGRRADLLAVDRRGAFVIIEVKSSRADFRADRKWPDYRPFCDAFYFAVAPDFPSAMLPADSGLIVADRYEGALLRPAPSHPLAAARRRSMTLRFARLAAARLMMATDAGLVPGARER
jgi:hypothetical protein